MVDIDSLYDAQALYADKLAELVAAKGLAIDPDCGFVHVAPYPSAEALSKLYTDEYLQQRYPLAPEFAEIELQVARRRYLPILDAYQKLLPGRKRILDIGSSGGEFLYLAKEAGFEAVGVDSSTQGLERSRKYGLEVIDGLFAKAQTLVSEKFDFVNLSFVLEHVPDLGDFLGEVRNVIADDGILSISVPNDFNPYQMLAYMRGNAPWWIIPDEHLNYFSPRSLTKLLQQHGWQVDDVRCSFPVDEFLAMDENYLTTPGVGQACYGRRQSWYDNLRENDLGELIAKQEQAWAASGVGREIYLLARP